ncbi:MAG: hypothetical protein KAS96_02405 [Planctomycetes bacterium]|nr:hypothetical protein [Planctomycetota bacterium]
MLRVLIFLLIAVCFCGVGCKKKPAVEPAKSTSMKKEVQVEDITKENMEEELNNLEKQIEEENLE